MQRSTRLTLLAVLALAARAASAQEPAEPAPAQGAQAAPPPEQTEPQRSPHGRFHVGPFWLTPVFRIGTIGLDTNVFYSPDEHQTDVAANGGPGLDLVLPISKELRLATSGTLNYHYFVRSEALRRFSGGGAGSVILGGERAELAVTEGWTRTYGRPSFEVDSRIVQDAEVMQARARARLLYRFTLEAFGRQSRHRLPDEESFLGTNLSQTLNRDERSLGGALKYAVTVKTSLVVDADRQVNSFPLFAERDATQDQIRAGVRTDESALIAGHALFGLNWFRPKGGLGQARTLRIGDVAATAHISPRTSLTFNYLRTRQYSALDVSEGPPTVRVESFGVLLEKELVGQRVDLRLFGRLTRMDSEGTARLDLPDSGLVTSPRNDTFREAGANLGYRFRSKLRIGLDARYADRNSRFRYFGVDGLLIGATVDYSP